MKRGVKPYCSHCRHDSHKGRACGYGKGIGTTIAVCVCETDKKGRLVKPDVLTRSVDGPPVEPIDTRFAAALDDASRALAAASAAFALAADEARIARATAMGGTPMRPVAEILKTPTRRKSSASPEVPLASMSDEINDVVESHTSRPFKNGTTIMSLNGETKINGVPTPLDPETALRAATLSDGPRKVLAAMALYPNGATSRQLIAQTSFSARTITNYMSELRGAGLVERGTSTITSAGHDFLRANRISLKARALAPGLRSVLVVMAKYPNGPTARQICLHTKFSARTVTNYVSELRGRGYVVKGELRATEEGRQLVAHEVGEVRTGKDLFWERLKDLGSGEANLAKVIWDFHPNEASSAELQERTGFSARTITNYLSTLRGHMLVARGSIALSPEMAHAHGAQR